ncbi:hypothetical protein SteCoe_18065 [Stentor coeruleus]|uniref:RRM domain-containing protein n=1 Tax=Stentor coeruleus TaxID=5963 RepID=A0A1R2BXD0_9CILI|nr:hypothetical protein SteCoe_18065 [Stentor coeruleus]
MQDKKVYTRVFVGNIPYSSNEKKVREHMSKAGEVQNVELFLDEVGVSRGCGIIEYTDPSNAARAIEMLHHSRIEGGMITVKEDESYSYNRRRAGNIYLKLRNLPASVTGVQLKDLCSLFGTVTKSEVVLDNAGRSRGAAMVVFSKPEEALSAFNQLNKATFNDREILAFIDNNDINKA